MIPFVYAFEGRIHSAVVSGIDLINQSLTVEWFERGETKGKEVQLYSESFLFMNFVATVTRAGILKMIFVVLQIFVTFYDNKI